MHDWNSILRNAPQELRHEAFRWALLAAVGEINLMQITREPEFQKFAQQVWPYLSGRKP